MASVMGRQAVQTVAFPAGGALEGEVDSARVVWARISLDSDLNIGYADGVADVYSIAKPTK